MGSKTAFHPKAAATPVFVPALSEANLILFEKTARCQVIITSIDGIVDSQVLNKQ
ncbi:MAG: hypothetical protein WA946_07730 [Nitrospirota bacterium]